LINSLCIPSLFKLGFVVISISILLLFFTLLSFFKYKMLDLDYVVFYLLFFELVCIAFMNNSKLSISLYFFDFYCLSYSCLFYLISITSVLFIYFAI